MTTNNVYSGDVVPFIAFQFNTFGLPSGSYTFTMNTVGFPGAINLYQNFFDPTTPNANFWADGAVANAGGTISQTLSLPGNSLFEVVFSAKTTGNSGTFSATVSGPNNVTISTTTNTTIRVGPANKTIASGGSVALRVYGNGPLPHKWQWYGGNSGNTTYPIAGATNESLGAGPLFSSTSYWVKVTGPAGSGVATSSTANITVTGNPGANFSGSLAMGGCTLPNNELYAVQRFQIQSAGNYTFNITAGFSLTTYEGVFDPLHPQNNLWGVLNGYYAAGTYDLVISKAGAGAFSGSIGNGPAIVNLLAPLPPQFLSSPQDTTIPSGQSAALHVSTTCGTPFTLQWYRGNSGNTNSPIAGATGFTYTTPNLFSNTTYWARMTHAGGAVDSGAGTVFVANGPVGDIGALTVCDHTFNRPSGPGQLSGSFVFYKTFVFQPAVDGNYTFVITNNFWDKAYIYDGIFSAANPLLNLSYIAPSDNFTATLLSGHKYYLVIAGGNPTNTGTYGVTVTVGPALVTKSPAPIIISQPGSTNVFRNQTVTLSVTSPSVNVSYQWYGGTDCGKKFPISGANSNSYTPPPITNYTNYWAELTTPGGYLFSAAAAIGVKPQATNDSFVTAEDTPLTVTAPGVVANDSKADNRILIIVNYSQPSHGKLIMGAAGDFIYSPATNYFGPDSFTYQASDGMFSVFATVNITVTPVNDPPIPGSDTLQTTVNTPVSVALATLLANDVDPEGDALSVVSYNPISAQGGSITIQNGIFTYHPPKDFFGTDTFHYDVQDTDGFGSDCPVTVTIPNPELLRLHITCIPNGVHLKFLGEDGHTYVVQHSMAPGSPWNDLMTTNAPAGGIVELDDILPAPQPAIRIYRVMEP
jgi:hypothetical protein